MVWVPVRPALARPAWSRVIWRPTRFPHLYRVDGGDADPATFFCYLGQALRKQGRASASPLPLLTAEYLLDLPGFSSRLPLLD